MQVERDQDGERAVVVEATEPAEIRAVQAGFPTHGKPESRAPARPAAAKPAQPKRPASRSEAEQRRRHVSARQPSQLAAIKTPNAPAPNCHAAQPESLESP
ncbi:MAG TPA: hypothetical protein VIP05_31170 [Burkholderiaceae bacterium]